MEQVLGPDAGSMLAAPISAPIVEELAKALGVLAVFWLLRAEFDNMRDGFVYGALVGLGFTWFEAPLYVAQGYRSEEHTSELQSQSNLVCRLLLEKKKTRLN